ncbi:unnamed protein product [Heligmosomoides polygyrus]|uniref:C-type lectin domain-containing protein n=1 Tax=Heligmosomoides polygyrus TaxID=6339 RepID=A0A3P7UVP5_HELPZ|nr:unnamed protein product [Heligmosomoides polygyrus]
MLNVFGDQVDMSKTSSKVPGDPEGVPKTSKDYEWLFDNMGNVSVNGWQGGDPEGGANYCMVVSLKTYKFADLTCVGKYSTYGVSL